MQPFKMMVGDMVNEEQKTKAYSIQSLLCNAGSLVGYLFPYFFSFIGISSVADPGQIPDSVTWSFYIGAAILILCVFYTGAKVKEWNPEDYAKYNNIKKEDETQSSNLFSLLIHAPKVFWQIGLVQFFSWFAFLYMWTYTTGGIAETVWGAINPASPEYQAAGDWTGVLFAVQAVGSILWAMVIPMFRSSKVAYSVSLLLGAAGFISTYFIHDQYILFVSFLLIGCAWAAMLALPFALLTNALTGKSLGSYMGLFNCTICLPQIIASLVGGVLFMTFGGQTKYIEVEVAAEETKTEAVAEVAETTEDVITLDDAVATADQTETEASTEAEQQADVVVEESSETKEAIEEVKTELKEFQSGQIIMLVIAGISLILGALAVFGISTRRKEE